MSDDNYDPITEFSTNILDSGALHKGPRGSWDTPSWLGDDMTELRTINTILLTGSVSPLGISTGDIEARFRDGNAFWLGVTAIPDVLAPERSLLAQPGVMRAVASLFYRYMWEPGSGGVTVDQRRATARQFMNRLGHVDFRHREDSVFLLHAEDAPGDNEIAAVTGDERLPTGWRDRADVTFRGGRVVVGCDTYTTLAIAVLLRFSAWSAVLDGRCE